MEGWKKFPIGLLLLDERVLGLQRNRRRERSESYKATRFSSHRHLRTRDIHFLLVWKDSHSKRIQGWDGACVCVCGWMMARVKGEGMVPVPPVSAFPVPEMANVATINATTQTAKVKRSGLDDAILL